MTDKKETKKKVITKPKKVVTTKKEKTTVNFVQIEGDIISQTGTTTTSGSGYITNVTPVVTYTNPNEFLYMELDTSIKQNKQTIKNLPFLELKFVREFLAEEIKRYGGFGDAGGAEHRTAIDRMSKVMEEIHSRINNISW